ncbi:MAG: SLC13 family permease [Kiritimatiellae bacterium]|nr:SLC13 family permease [Kiritimatiellia bacterium]
MHSASNAPANPFQAFIKIATMAAITAFLGWGAYAIGIAPTKLPIIAVCTFIATICTTLFFWPHRVAVAFLGMAVLIGTRAMTLKGMMEATELDIIFFLIGMMIIVGALKDLGFLTWIIQTIISQKKMNGTAFTIILCFLSAILSSVLGEVSSIIVVMALVFQVCDTLKIKATPFVMISVLCTNIGSAATMLGNPVGIFIGNKAGFTFGQFLTGATPVAIVCIFATIVFLHLWYRRDIHDMTVKMQQHRNMNKGLGPLVRLPFRRGLFVLIATVVVIAFHHQIETALHLTGADNKNAFLIMTPLIVAGLLMIYRPQRARSYVEHDVEWWTLIFFMLLFAIAGGLAAQGVTANMAHKLSAVVTGGPKAMLPLVLFISSIGSAFVDNIVFVAAFTPVIQSLTAASADYSVLWWALLFGACFGGNITAIGSTANIVALGLLEKRGHAHVAFLEWLKVGACVGLLTALIAWAMLSFLPMPHPNLLHESPEESVESSIQGSEVRIDNG